MARLTSPAADFAVVNHGSICVLTALTEAALDWIDFHLPDDRQRWGRTGTVVEPRYLGPILGGIIDDGLVIGGAQ